MNNPGSIGYVLINFDGIPVKHFPEDLPAVQYSALISDLVMKTKSTLKQLNVADSEFNYLRMRTKQDTEVIVTDYITPGNNEYILVCIQSCKFGVDEVEDEEEEGK
jgi:predicted regulator of Ras-like GTPase activity (Roadblock/LC7/MglB family)